MQIRTTAKAFMAIVIVFLAVTAHATTAVESVISTFPGDMPSQLIQAHDGNFYGTSRTGGTGLHGYVFRLTTGGTRTVIYNFLNGADGGAPLASLIEGNDGNLYGTNSTGGLGPGVLFRMTLAGAITPLHSFAGSGLFDELPRLKIITHHMGGMIPYFSGKITLGFRQIFEGTPTHNPVAEERGLKRQPLDYFKMLYADTALNGAQASTRCGHDFFGTSFCLFATDAPFDAEGGHGLIRNTIDAVAALEITAGERERIFSGNARALLKLPTAAKIKTGAA